MIFVYGFHLFIRISIEQLNKPILLITPFECTLYRLIHKYHSFTFFLGEEFGPYRNASSSVNPFSSSFKYFSSYLLFILSYSQFWLFSFSSEDSFFFSSLFSSAISSSISSSYFSVSHFSESCSKDFQMKPTLTVVLC